jgi:RNA polymerase sigma-70 factor (ECF subfamily)
MSHDEIERLTRNAMERANALVLYARQWLDEASADDVVPEALVRLLCLRAAPDNVAAWMYQAVRNAAFDFGRSASRRRRREQVVAMQRCEMFDENAAAPIDAATAEAWLERLSAEHREVVVLRIWGDLAFAEIAGIVGAAVSTVHDRYKAALRELRRCDPRSDDARRAVESSCKTNI